MARDSRISGDLQKIHWRSRRGMLELDLLLAPFTLEVYPDLPPEDQFRYRQLLECEDQDLIAWLMRREAAADRQPLIDRILAHNAARSEKAG